MERLPEPTRLTRTFKVCKFALPVVALGATFFTLRSFARTGWPFADANWQLVVASAAAMIGAQWLRSLAWRLLLPQQERPLRRVTFTVVNAAAASSHLLPVGLDLAVKVGLLHRLERRLQLKAIAVSLAGEGLLDNAAMLPLAAMTFFVVHDSNLKMLAGVLCLVSLGCLPAAWLAPRLVRRLAKVERAQRISRLAAAIDGRIARNEDGRTALTLLGGCWLCRLAAAYSLMAALSIGAPLQRALLLTVLTPLANLIPSPSGATTSVGAAAAILSVAGVGSHAIVSYALSASVLALLTSLFATTVGGSTLLLAEPTADCCYRTRLRQLLLAPLAALR